MLTDIACKNAKPKAKPYKLSDSGGLYLEVMPSGSRCWRLKYRILYQEQRKEKRLSLGIYPQVSLKDARKKRDDAKELLVDGIDPSREKQRIKQDKAKEQELTFARVAEDWYQGQQKQWKPQHAEKTWRRIEMHVFPTVGNIPVSELTARDVIRCIKRIEDAGAADIAKRAFQNIKRILDYAVLHDLTDRNVTYAIRTQDILSSPKVRHNPHLEAHELPDFFKSLAAYEGERQTVLALKLMFLVFVRHNELLHARWDEFHLDTAEWRIPAERMKMSKPHVVPLSKQALAILEELRELNHPFELVFPQKRNPRKPMSNGGMTTALHAMGYKGKLTVHGIRGTASTILNENGFRHTEKLSGTALFT